MAIAFGILVGVLAVLVYAAWKRSKINADGGCPVCFTELPMYRRPASFRQAMMGGWTCETCGTELDRNGIQLVADNARS